MTLERITLGKQGEDLACRELRRRDYTIVERRFRTRLGEIDIVALDGQTLVFIEVKARSGSRFGTGFDAVTPSKRRRICAMARDYLARHGAADAACRFDVVSIDMSRSRPEVTVVVGAFSVGE